MLFRSGRMTHNPGRMTHNPGHMTHNPGHMTHNPGRMTHNFGCMTHNPDCMTQSKSYALSIPCCYHLMPVQKLHKNYKCSALSLFLAINCSIYYLLNGTFNRAYDVNHLINRLLLMLQQYITRCNDFKYHWFTLLLSGLLRSQHISLWFIFVLYLSIHIIAKKLF